MKEETVDQQKKQKDTMRKKKMGKYNRIFVFSF
jgi:hypothetical protein